MTSPVPEPDKTIDAAALKVPAPVTTENRKDDAGAGEMLQGGPRVAWPAPKLPTSEPIFPPPSLSTFLPEACLILADEVVGTPQQQPNVEEAGVAGTSAGGILVTPPVVVLPAAHRGVYPRW
jgi:hypothetical protein